MNLQLKILIFFFNLKKNMINNAKKKIDNSYKLFNGGFKSITAIKIKIDFIKKDNFI